MIFIVIILSKYQKSLQILFVKIFFTGQIIKGNGPILLSAINFRIMLLFSIYMLLFPDYILLFSIYMLLNFLGQIFMCKFL